MADAPTEETALQVESDEQREIVQTSSRPPGKSESTVPTTPLPEIKHAQTNLTNASGGRPYSAFSSGEKWFIVILSAVAGIFSPISSFMYVPAIPTMADAFHVTSEKINLTVTVYLIFQALTPAIWGAAADCFGRRPIYIIVLLIYILSCVGTALCPTSAYWLLILMRIAQATGGAAVIAIGTGVIADIAMPQERGKYLGVFNLSTTFGPAIGPLLGGVFAATLGWRSIFWFLVILCAVALVPMILFFPETLRSLVGDGTIPPPLLNCTPAALLRRKRELREMEHRGEEVEATRSHRAKFKPWVSFLLAFEPDLFLIFIWASLYYALWYAVLTIFSTLLRDAYGSSEIIIGLSYIPNGLGAGLSSLISGRIMDFYYRREKKRVRGDHRARPEEFRLERTRFLIFPYQVGLLVASSIAMGWSLKAKAPIAVPIVLNFFVGIGAGFLTTTTIYGVDLFTGQGGAVTATFNLVRCLLGAVTVSVIQLMNSVMGPGWSFVALSGICILATPMPLIVLRYGPRWRLRRARRAKAKDEEKKRAERERIDGLATAGDQGG